MGLQTTRERVTAATVTKRYGAWLISWEHGPVADDLTPIELYDCASSLAVAKRVAVEGARRLEYEGAVRWSVNEGGWEWTLTMTLVGEEFDGEYD